MINAYAKKILRSVTFLNPLRKWRVKFLERLDFFRLKFIVPFFGKSPFLSRFYYLFFQEFQRENQAILHGIHRNFKHSILSKTSTYELVRSIHRLEKGISMPARKKIFALEYIGETLSYYDNVVKNFNQKEKMISPDQLVWAHDVLECYFEIMGDEPVTADFKKTFKNMPSPHRENTNGKKLAPYQRKDTPQSGVNYETFYNLALQRRSVRWFLPKRVPRQIIDKAIKAAYLSPSDCNTSPYELLVFDTPEMVKKIGTITKGARGFGEHIPVIVVFVGKLEAYSNEGSRHGIYINTGLLSMTFAYALETLGLASCMLNWPDIDRNEIKLNKILNLKPDERVTMLMGLGYPDPEGYIPYSAKKDIECARKYFS